MIKLQGLDKFFNKGKQNEIHVINNITLELPERGMVAFFGKSGCGKTTLLNVLGGLDSFESGGVSIDGQSIRENTDTLRNKYIGYIFQNYNLNKGESCFENIADALRLCGMNDEEAIKARVMAALRNVGLEHYHARTPDTLSGGQQQRIAIARAIVKNPRIILADEPTGNLDEANTVMIMDLLKEISRDHLVLLVTHEANLVDYYCDTVIELSDGKVMSVRHNEGAEGYSARGKNDIYLGELEKQTLTTEGAELEYYGDSADTPVKLKIVNSGGKIYVRIDTAGVQVLDRQSEVKLCEGVYQEKRKTDTEQRVDMTELPPVEGSKFGRLFGFRGAVKSGYRSNFKKGKKGKKVLRGCLMLFAAVVVIMGASFGTAIADIMDVRSSYNHNVFYVYTPDGETSDALYAAIGDSASGIDYTSNYYGTPSGDLNIKFTTGFFETFTSSQYDESFRTNAVVVRESLAEGKRVLVGSTESLPEDGLIISSAVAEALLDKSSLGYITEYDDLLGLTTQTLNVDGKPLRIMAVVDCDEPLVYLGRMAMAKRLNAVWSASVMLGSKVNMTLDEGRAVYAYRVYPGQKTPENLPKVGEKITIQGKEITVDRLIRYTEGYADWLSKNGIKKEDSTEDQNTFEYYDYYFDKVDDFLSEKAMFNDGDIYTWLYAVKGIDAVKYHFMGVVGSQDGVRLYGARAYKEKHGTFPTMEQYNEALKSGEISNVYDIIDAAQKQYQEEFDRTAYRNPDITNKYIVSDEDFMYFAEHIGAQPSTVWSSNAHYGEDVYYYEDVSFEKAVDIGYAQPDIGYAYSSSASLAYTLVHSSDPDKTAEYLAANFGHIQAPNTFSPAMLTPQDIYDESISEYSEQIIASLIAMVIILVLMSICMYFIMRSSLMNRIKEVGIYRAIGVSKKNVIYKFFVESLVLTTLTVFVGYILTSAFLAACLGTSSFMESILFYPLPFALAILAVLYAVCLFFGTLPTINLLRKTPSTILSKYDI